MAKYFLAGFLILFSLSLLIALAIPEWLIALLGLAAGVLVLIDR